MRIALPVWGDRISPVFDTAEQLLVVDFEGRQEISRHRLDMGGGSLPTRLEGLKARSPEVLLCGAISRPLVDLLDSAGIEVIPFLSGNIEDLLQAYLEERLPDPRYLMPGCLGRKRQRRSRCRERKRTGE